MLGLVVFGRILISLRSAQSRWCSDGGQERVGRMHPSLINAPHLRLDCKMYIQLQPALVRYTVRLRTEKEPSMKVPVRPSKTTNVHSRRRSMILAPTPR